MKFNRNTFLLHANIIFFCLALTLISSCSNSEKKDTFIQIDQISILTQKKAPLTAEELNNWHFKDIFKDTIPGISLEKTYAFLKDRPVQKPVIVAIIDMAIDIEHEDLKGRIWKNLGEIPENGIDDDDNRYIDDVQGWNFLGRKDGTSNEFTNYEYTRILRNFLEYKNGVKDTSLLSPTDKKLYNRALSQYNGRLKYAEERLVINESNIAYFKSLDSVTNLFFTNKNYDKSDLDSVIHLNKNNKELVEYLENISTLLEQKDLRPQIDEQYLQAKERIDKLLNLNYDDRALLGDNPEDLEDINYGNPIVNYNVKRMDHGTPVAGIIAANRKNNEGIKGFSDAIKIMPLVISGYGDEHDKDMALAIRYAVDNGAKIINISSGKYFSSREDWILDAIKYAAKENVLIVHATGNDNLEIDQNKNFIYPNDIDSLGQEVAQNFIAVGSSSSFLTKKLKASSSNYSKINVDVFAPGVDIYTTTAENNSYATKSGTSYAAPMVSGIAALIKIYYPDLKAHELKNIILQSAIKYDVMVETKNDSLVPFHTLSKSGGIVNAYNAMLLAKELSND